MSTMQDQYNVFAQHAQDASSAFVDAWTRSVRDAGAKLPTVTVQAATQEAIDQAFDLATRLMDVQRSYAKHVAGSSVGVIEEVANRVTTAATEATTATARSAKTKA